MKLFAASNVRTGWQNYVSKGIPRDKGEVDGEPSRRKHDHVSGRNRALKTKSGTIDYAVAHCCNPIPGDEVIGLLASDQLPMQIHRTKCQKAQELMTVYGTKMVSVNWENFESISFVAEIKVMGVDRQGLINEITRIISNELNLNIKSFHIEAMEGLTEGAIALYVKNTTNLNDALIKLSMVEGMNHVARIN